MDLGTSRTLTSSVPPEADVLVIGGGPAGATAAAALAHSGRRVTLLDAATGPRDKVCGECLSALGIASLERLGLATALDELRPTRLRRTMVFSQKGRAATLDLPRPMWGATRRAMDAVLLDAATESGVDVRRGVRALRVEPGERPRVSTAGGEQIDCRLVILADGKGTLAGSTVKPPRPTGDFGLKTHFAGVNLPGDAVALFGLSGHYVGLAPVRDGRGEIVWNLAMSLPTAVLKSAGGDFDGLLSRLCEEGEPLREAMAGAEQAGDWLTCPLPRFAPRSAGAWGRNVIPVGNAAAALEPVGGEGMGLAVASAVLAADAVCNGMSANDLRRRYARLWRTRRTACRAGAMLLSNPRTAGPAIALANRLPALGAASLRLAGKGATRLPTRPPVAVS